MSDGSVYKLRCSLPGHSKDVRCVAVGQVIEECIISGSRDKTAKLWQPEGLGYVCDQTYIGNDGYVSAVTVGLYSENFPSGAVITGCQDGKIRIYNAGASNPVSTLNGHTDTVCTLVTQSGFLLSGSWDKTAKLWQSDGSIIFNLTGHSAAVWAVEILQYSASVSELIMLTASADKTIKMWKGESPFQIFKGHTDCVRALAVCDSNRFLSAANDATIRLWITSGECVSVFYGHTNYIYGLCMMPGNNEFVSCGEDRSLRLWKLDLPDECQQTIFLPAQSIWDVKVMGNGDIVTGSSDGLVRVFTKDADRTANTEILHAFEEELAATSLNAQLELGGIKSSDLPGQESLLEPGKREGQTKMVRNGNVVSCYSWSASTAMWTKVGDVVGAAGQSDSTKNFYEGKEYDYVFSVDIDEGKPPLKLPYNSSENPWLAAQKFIHKNDLSQYHLDTVANFIIKNSKSSWGNGNSTSNANETFTDPLTGGSRYVPSFSVPQESVVQAQDPFTGSGRYIPPSEMKSVNTYFPVKSFLRFDQANIEAIKSKLKEFNEKVEPSLKIPEAELCTFLTSADENSDPCAISSFENFMKWPADKMFPALDILRLASRHPQVVVKVMERGNFIDVILAVARSAVPNCMMVYRIISHLLSHTTAQETLLCCCETICASIESILVASDSSFTKHPQWKNVEIAVSTVILNFSSLIRLKPSNASVEIKSTLLGTIGEILPKLQEEEALFRTLAATGTLLEDKEALAVAQSLHLNSRIEYLQSVTGKVGECSKLICEILQ